MSIGLGTGNHYSAILKDGIIHTAGENTNSQLARGAGTEAELTSFEPIVLPEGFAQTITKISGGQLHGAFLTAEGDVYTWGDGNLGKLGNGSTANIDKIVPAKVAALDGVEITSILMANGASYAISDEGVVYAWGQNTNGQLGLGNTVNQGTPVALSTSSFGGEKVAQISPGTSFTLFLTESGEVYAAGGNVQQQIGPNGSGRSVSTPVLVDIPGKVVSIEAGTNTAVVITDSGAVYGWGQSDFGQLLKGTVQADGTLAGFDAASSATPTLLPGLPGDLVEIHIGSRWGIGITANGEVWVWGNQGWLDSTKEDTVFAPHRVPDLDGVRIVDVEAGPNHALLVSADGDIYGLGSTADGRLGFLQADADRASAPVLVSIPADTVQIVVDGANSQTTGSTITAGTLAEGKTSFHLYGFAGDDTLIASDNGDVLSGGDGNDKLFGGLGVDRLEGGAGNDTLEGADGRDVLIGGLGNDTYIIGNNGDLVVEAADGGRDRVISETSYTLTDHVEVLQLVGKGAVNGTGNNLGNYLGGNSAANTLDGKAGADTMIGGAGNDTYLVDNAGDMVREVAGEGKDRVVSSVSYELTGDVETLQLVGKGAIDGTGNTLDNYLGGNGAANTLDGGAGRDTLYGGAGSDTFRFRAGEAGGDFIGDFQGGGQAGSDRILLIGYGTDARITQVGTSDNYRIESADGMISETIRVAGVFDLTVSDTYADVLFA